MVSRISRVRLGSSSSSRTARGHDQDLDGRHHALAIGAGDQALRDDALEHRRQRQPDLLLLMRREHADDAVDRLDRVERVQRRHDEVAGLGRVQRGLDRLLVAHFADQDDVGILPQRRAAAPTRSLGVEADLALVDDRAPVVDA